uniref:Transmembrane protein 238a n=1 Tax=Sinocyclocheilus anshuiensis TaxID=1608454 RepID=A0A671KK45_9TELE
MCIWSCAALFVLGIAFDVTGFALLCFGSVFLDGRFYGDFLIYTDSLIVVLSVFWWVMWYTGNSSEDLEKRTCDNCALLSERLNTDPQAHVHNTILQKAFRNICSGLPRTRNT